MQVPEWDLLIRQHRLHFGLTQQDLADRLGISQKTISRWESGEHKPAAAQQVRLRDLFYRPTRLGAGRLADSVRHCPALRALSRHEGLKLLALSPPVAIKNPERMDWIGCDLISRATGILAEMLDDRLLEKDIQNGDVACIRTISESLFKLSSPQAPTYYETTISFFWLDKVLFRDAVSVPLGAAEQTGYWPVALDCLVRKDVATP
jgi:transcriptional regulator with XRE-family HTH domain